MTPLEQCRVHVLDALQGLKEAHHSLADDRPMQAQVQITTARLKLDEALAILNTLPVPLPSVALNSQPSVLSSQ